MWNELLDMSSQVTLSEEAHKVKWLLTKSGSFSVKSLYHYLIARVVAFPFKLLWRLRIPLKVKAFIWLVIKGRILTKDNLSRRGWKGPNFCEFCGVSESIDHLLFSCSFVRFLWNVIWGSLGNLKLPLLIFVRTGYHPILVRTGMLFLLVLLFWSAQFGKQGTNHVFNVFSFQILAM